jgi:hypothetical protein
MPGKGSMAKKPKSSDVNVNAFEILKAVTGESPATPRNGKPTKKPSKAPIPVKNPAAVALGRLGGLKGGKARAEKLSAKKRAAIAKNAAKMRWAARAD